MTRFTGFLFAVLAALAFLTSTAHIAIASPVRDDLDLADLADSIKDSVGLGAAPGNSEKCWYTRIQRAHCSGDCEYDPVYDMIWCKKKCLQKYGKLWCTMCRDKPRKCI
ncbi:hypothetical protein GGF32_002071 [Allomyces javanicus]|nr:hypothetical protein GGF32_002071 [Allomyces javanicus]